MPAGKAEGFDAAIKVHGRAGTGDCDFQHFHDEGHQRECDAEQDRLAPGLRDEECANRDDADKDEEAAVAERRDGQHQQVQRLAAQGGNGIRYGAIKCVERPETGLAQGETGKQDQAETGAQPLCSGYMHGGSMPHAMPGSKSIGGSSPSGICRPLGCRRHQRRASRQAYPLRRTGKGLWSRRQEARRACRQGRIGQPVAVAH